MAETTIDLSTQSGRLYKQNNTKPNCDCAIGQHLLKNEQCAFNYDNKQFSVLATACSSFHLNLLKAVYIKTQRTMLCIQKEFVYSRVSHLRINYFIKGVY